MSKVVFAYVDGSDLGAIGSDLESRFQAFVSQRAWSCPNVRVVNQRQAKDSVVPRDLPDWDLGLNLSLSPRPNDNWFEDFEATARFLAELHQDGGRDFVIGLYDSDTGVSEDLFFVDSAQPDLEALKRCLAQTAV